MTEKISFDGIESEKLRRRYAYLRYQKSSIICAGIKSESLINAAIGVLKYILVIEWACLLINF